MSNVIHLHPAAKSWQVMREEASLWIVMISEGASEEDLQKVHEWLEEHPDHVQALMDVARMWDEVSVLSELSDIFPLEEYVNPQPVKVRRGMVYATLAVCLVLLSFFSLDWLPGTGSESSPDTAQLSYETRVGQQSTVVLPDGSVVVLNTNTHIEMSFSSTYRDIILHRGEGHFTVEKNSSRPFRVHTNGGIVEAVGTAFTVQQLGHEGLEVSVLEGEVNFTRAIAPEPAVVAPPAASLEQEQSQPRAQPTAANTTTAIAKTVTSPISLVAGERVEVNSKDDNVMKQTIGVAELQSRLAWRDGMLLFQGDTLETVIREVSRYTSIRIDVDEKVRDIPVLGNFRTGDVEGILLSMSTTFNLQVERLEEGHIVLKAAN